MKIIQLYEKLAELEDKLTQLLAMTEKEACTAYNTDTKDEAIEDFQEEISYTKGSIEENEEDEDWSGIDPGFADEADFLRYKFG